MTASRLVDNADVFIVLLMVFCFDAIEKLERKTGKMKITMTNENDQREVNYLDCTISSNENRITPNFRWTKKNILNFDSNQREHVKAWLIHLPYFLKSSQKKLLAEVPLK